MAAAWTFDAEHKDNEDYTTTAVVHADDVVAWLWGVGVGRIDKTCYSTNPDDGEHSSFLLTRQQQCISGVIPAAGVGHDVDVI